MINTDLYRAIIEEYCQNKSIRRTATNLNVSVVKVRRTLITENLWSSQSSEKIGKLYKQGLSTKEIADRLFISLKDVQAFIPYSRGVYNENKTSNSKRSKLYRARKSNALKGAVMSNDIKDNVINISDIISSDKTLGTDNAQIEMGKTIPYMPSSGDTLQLKLEIVCRSYEGDDYERTSSYLGDDFYDLKRLAKANEGISRTVLVPSNLTLHSLHYLIQKAFGFQNSHLHSFSLLNSDFKALTEDNYGKWKKYQGSIFRVPSEDSDRFYDDDYAGNVSINTWLKKKYQGIREDNCASDTYLYQTTYINDFEDEIAGALKIKKGLLKTKSLSSLMHSFISEPYDTLVERLTVGEVLKPNVAKVNVKALQESLNNSLMHCDELTKELSKETLSTLKENLFAYVENFNNYIALNSGHFTGVLSPVQIESHKENYEWAIGTLKKHIWPRIDVTNPRLEPFTSNLLYSYDFGDDWQILITCEGCRSYKVDKPICIEADGRNLIEDCGGISGYVEILKTINGETEDNPIEAKEWAKYMGYTGRISKPGNIV